MNAKAPPAGFAKSTHQQQAEYWFELLEPLLKDRKLPCENGPARVCGSDEFMFMQAVNGEGQFKHCDSRNYLIVRKERDPNDTFNMFKIKSPNGFELFVPFTTSAFSRGFFDRIELPEA